MSSYLTTNMWIKLFANENQKTADNMDHHFKKSSDDKHNENSFTYYSRHDSIFEYTETPKIEFKKIERNRSLDLKTISEMKKLVFGSTKHTNHDERTSTTIYPYSKIA